MRDIFRANNVEAMFQPGLEIFSNWIRAHLLFYLVCTYMLNISLCTLNRVLNNSRKIQGIALIGAVLLVLVTNLERS